MNMMMEGVHVHVDQEEVVVCNKDQLQIIKGKRTKRPRPMSPLTLAMLSSSTTTTTSSSGGGGDGEGDKNSITDDSSRGFDDHDHQAFTASPTTSDVSTEEEEDMANCLILLAQGGGGSTTQQTRIKPVSALGAAKTNKTAAVAVAAVAGNGLYAHQCKTCNRCFPSFQALGGHRASHKKPNNKLNEENKGFMFSKEDDHEHSHNRFNNMNMNTTLSLQISNNHNYKGVVLCNKPKVHECSICGAEFSSGQALGGHMRRHRTLVTNNSNVPTATTTATTCLSVGITSSPESDIDQSNKKPRTVLQLDLNLPAPEDHESKFSFASKEKLLVFSASSLVDCHY
ncbi:Zinc finger, C2H2-like protein [Corchorus olitorius]|uniref:Zinc finger, C2H2-like protein n=1 Tax=Corchorus olitorius TaxID=93759 RepID=A0A1R3HTL3_9ROSI|nr:Zinc finger, C2H2-like protein [Corchorus olitorius]